MFLWLLLFVVVLWYWQRLRYFAKWDHIPGYKSTWSFPLVGHLYMYAKAPMEKLLESHEKFGDIFRQDSGFIPTVWLCNYEDIITALKQDSLQHRSHHRTPGMAGIWGLNPFGYLYGTLFASGQWAAEQRRFVVQHISSKKNIMEDIIMQESAIFKDEITKTSKSGAPVPVPGLFLEMVNCVLWRVVTGRPVDGAVRKVLTDNVRESMKMAEGRPLQVLQICSFSFTKFCKMMGWPNLIDMLEPMKEIFRAELKQASLDNEGNFFEKFLTERQSAKPGTRYEQIHR